MPLQLVDHRPASRVDAEVLERLLEIRDVGFPLRVEHLPPDQGEQEHELLRRREDQRSDRRDVRLQRLAGDHHQVFRQVYPHLPLRVLLLVDAAVGLVFAALVGPHGVHQPVLRPPGIAGFVGQKNGGAAHSKEAVRQKHRSFRSSVIVRGDDLCTDDQGIAIRVELEEITGKIDGYDAGAATHAGKIEAFYVTPHLVLVHDHGGQRRRRREQAAVNDQYIDVFRLHPCFTHQRING
ncbi:unnamed protein product [Cuscuta epithymum]|uniref:Uncharacterized protein n=1 Tax=Cuscuta epithymum TaxID=186058 RepID=A0AAV0EB13_9ASTE|nr:unnamed protein product [Cuscuta epithymum]